MADLQSSPDVTNDNICNFTVIQYSTLRPRVTVELRDACTLFCRRGAHIPPKMIQNGAESEHAQPSNEAAPNVDDSVKHDEAPKEDETQKEIHEAAEEEAREKSRREREARAQALTLEIVGDLPYAEVKPPENVLFVCKLNPVTEGQNTGPTILPALY